VNASHIARFIWAALIQPLLCRALRPQPVLGVGAALEVEHVVREVGSTCRSEAPISAAIAGPPQTRRQPTPLRRQRTPALADAVSVAGRIASHHADRALMDAMGNAKKSGGRFSL